jgi:chromate transporter
MRAKPFELVALMALMFWKWPEGLAVLSCGVLGWLLSSTF